MPLLRNDDLVRIDLPAPGEWVEVKRRLSRGDEVAIQRSLLAGATLVAGGMPQLDAGAAIEAATFGTLDCAIRSWSFGVPVTPEAIRQLDGESIDAIKAALNALYPEARTEEERGNLSGDGAPHTLAVVPSPMTSVG